MQGTCLKIVLIGPPGVGKTNMVRTLKGEGGQPYTPTLGVDVHPIRVQGTNVCFNVWDCAGDPRFRGLGQGYFIASHACVVMFDPSKRHELRAFDDLTRVFLEMNPNSRIYFVPNNTSLHNTFINIARESDH
jgi:GTPase SAR1 family protein